MESYRGVVTAVHGMLFGVFFLLATYALLIELLRGPLATRAIAERTYARGWQRAYLIVTACLGWAAVLSGTFLVYPWYRAVPPAGADLHSYPKSLLLSSASTASLHTIGMEWKEHIAFLAPIAFTMLAYVLCRYGSGILRYPRMRQLLLTFSAVALFATGISGAVGAFLNKAAPTEGARTAPHIQTVR